MAVTCDETVYALETATINPTDKRNYWLIAIVLLAIVPLILLVVIAVGYYLQRGLTMLIIVLVYNVGVWLIKTSDSHEYRICHHWYFLKMHFTYLLLARNSCYDLLQTFTSFNNVVTVTVGKSNYRIKYRLKREYARTR